MASRGRGQRSGHSFQIPTLRGFGFGAFGVGFRVFGALGAFVMR